MHTVCCEQFISTPLDNIGPATSVFVDSTGYEDVPALVEVRFNGQSPTVGNVYTYNGLYNKFIVRKGVLQLARTNAQIALDYNCNLDSGFLVEYPQGIGRGVGIRNETDATLENVYISVRKLNTLVADTDGIKVK